MRSETLAIREIGTRLRASYALPASRPAELAVLLDRLGEREPPNALCALAGVFANPEGFALIERDGEPWVVNTRYRPSAKISTQHPARLRANDMLTATMARRGRVSLLGEDANEDEGVGPLRCLALALQ
jgi:hypothetical protein